MPPRDVSYFLQGVGVELPSSSHCSHQVLKKFYQVPLVHINNSSKSFCSHEVPKQFLEDWKLK